MLRKTLQIDKTSTVPLAQQIADAIAKQILDGTLPAGEKLPPERDFAEILGVSRTTIRRAYELLLQSHAIEMRQGSGSYVLANGEVLELNKKKEAAEIIAVAFERLHSMGLSQKEIQNLINLHHSSTQEPLRKISIMVVSNNCEILEALEGQLSYLSNTTFFAFTLFYLTLDNIKSNANPIKFLLDFDLIIATSIDYAAILKIVPCYAHKILEATITPCTETLITLSELPKTAKIGIIYRTTIFRDMVIDTLLKMGFLKERVFAYHESEIHLSTFQDNSLDVLINFNESPLYSDPKYQAFNEDFIKKGGQLLLFGYRIKRSALLKIEDHIQMLETKNTALCQMLG